MPAATDPQVLRRPKSGIVGAAMSDDPARIASAYAGKPAPQLGSKPPPTPGTGVPTASTADISTYDADTYRVRGRDTVAGQLDTLLSSGSPYLQRAEAGAMQTANARGLINSSMAAGAGQAAAIDAALPIAQQDASTNWQTGIHNMDARNTAGQFNANATNTGNQFNAESQNQLQRMGYGADLQEGLIHATGDETRQNISATGDQTRMNIGAEGDQTRRNISATGDETRLNIGAEGDQTRQNIEAQGDQTVRGIQTQGDQTRRNMLTQGEIDTQLQTLKGTQAESLANIQGQYSQLIGANSTAAGLYSSITNQIAQIQGDPNTSPEQKQQAVDFMLEMLQGGMSLVGQIGNIDIDLDFGGP